MIINMKRIVFIGASGHGKVCAEIAELSAYAEIIFLDNNKKLKECSQYPVVGVEADFKKFVDDRTVFFVSIGKITTRKRIQHEIKESGGKMAILLHPDSIISKDVRIGDGSVVMAGAVINPGTEIGEGVIVNTSSSIDHDCVIGNYSHIAVGTHLCGGVKINNESWIGAGAVINNNVDVCMGCIVGAGAVVVKDIEDAGTYVGIPARKNG